MDDYTDFAIGLGVMSIPTLILFKDGEEVGRLIGVQPKQAILNMIQGA
ncbi:MAG: thioredoxin domain-containing protein [Candidatus Faecivicinus sp.]